jgi:hypothetical protein
MGFASISGKAKTDVNNPRAFAVCDRCGQWRNHVDLQWQHDYRGRTLANLRILVCETCLDEPQPQLKPRIIPVDPVPILNARVEPFFYDETDERYTTNPALPNVDLATTTNTILSGYQFVDGVQTNAGELILVQAQTDRTKNGIYKAGAGVWRLQAYNNDNKTWYDAIDAGLTYYGQLGYYLGAVNVARGMTYFAKLFQVMFDPNGLLATGTPVTMSMPAAGAVNHYDFYTGIYMEGAELRVTQDSDPRSTQVVGQAAGNINEIPGYSNLVPGYCDIGKPNSVPYGAGTRQGLPSGFDSLPYAGPLWPTLQNQSIPVWMNYFALPSVWVNALGQEVTFNASGFWPNPGPGASMRIIGITADLHQWVNSVSLPAFWDNSLNQQAGWMNGVRMPICPPGGDILWLNGKCEAIEWYNSPPKSNILPSPLTTGQPPFNVNWGQIYPNALPPNQPGPWPYYGN